MCRMQLKMQPNQLHTAVAKWQISSSVVNTNLDEVHALNHVKLSLNQYWSGTQFCEFEPPVVFSKN